VGLVFVVAGGVAFFMTQDGYDSLQAFSEAQNVTLSYNEDGELIDRGTTEGAEAIMTLLTETWGYPVIESELDPNDPLVNTGSEYMYQMATVGYHVLHGTQTVVLTEDGEFNGEVIPAGSYDVVINEIGSPERVAAGVGGYWTDFNRSNPIEAAARGQAWTGTAHGLFAELGVGTVTHSALKMGLALAGLFAGVGATAILTGAGLVWASRKEDETKLAWSDAPVREDTKI
jgi:hypothetical protein